ncbi:hypothetical protein CROQUDRAFT_655578 [Cronartium quercuum f. sp. fusiforme G11]|uniref:Adenine DNA glycosylase n=1 Tax=Cronartium quercuum f. sp. fusiforme G11 TaxID=708437 RepID=A0A9P6NPL4_9BASI|nr:hypothetical protein CROQUDRAFT_655578 [Cronartium quercuum f. sp. fusiforme G11]
MPRSRKDLETSSLSNLSEIGTEDGSQNVNETIDASIHAAINSTCRLHSTSYHTSHLSLCAYQLSPPVKGLQRLDTTKDRKQAEPSFQSRLLAWYDEVKRDREMPWRKDVKDFDALTPQERGQRAYEVWVSEIMLQQTQVETVKSYYLRWMDKFPTVFVLAEATIEDVNEVWQGLGYYSRASRLLSGAKKVVKDFNGILPDDPAIMQAQVDGIGPYSAGAIASIAWGKQVAMIDGNIHRVLTRLTAFYAAQTSKSTNNFLWSVAQSVVPSSRPGDFNQALMELGATICKPRKSKCGECPLTQWCKAYQESRVIQGDSEAHTESTIKHEIDDIEDQCTLCIPFDPRDHSSTSSGDYIQIYPMAKERKKPSIKEVAVGVVEWRLAPIKMDQEPNSKDAGLSDSMLLLVKRPEKGLLAGLWEFPAIDLPVPNNLTSTARLGSITTFLKDILSKPLPSLLPSPINHRKKCPTFTTNDVSELKIDQFDTELDSIHHVFSHLKVEYKPAWIIISSVRPPLLKNPSGNATLKSKGGRPTIVGEAQWIPTSELMKSNIGNAHKKIWDSIASKRKAIDQHTIKSKVGRSNNKRVNQPSVTSAKKRQKMD